MDKRPSQTLIVTGMHRSGTSLVANYLSQCGCVMGGNLLPGSKHNRKGYYEDIQFLSFHEGILRNSVSSWHDVPFRGVLPITEHDKEAAKLLLEKRKHLILWGWKDPRTVLFLDFWAQLCPNAGFVFLYREPAQVLTSLLKRGDNRLHLYFMNRIKLFRYLKSLRLYISYNSRILDFINKHAHRCILLSLADVVAGNIQLLDAIREKLRITGFNQKPLEVVFRADLLHQNRTVLSRLVASTPGIRKVYRELEAKKYI